LFDLALLSQPWWQPDLHPAGPQQHDEIDHGVSGTAMLFKYNQAGGAKRVNEIMRPEMGHMTDTGITLQSYGVSLAQKVELEFPAVSPKVTGLFKALHDAASDGDAETFARIAWAIGGHLYNENKRQNRRGKCIN
jgi:hypothetical protein